MQRFAASGFVRGSAFDFVGLLYPPVYGLGLGVYRVYRPLNPKPSRAQGA